MAMLTLYPLDSSKAKTKKALKAYALGKDVDSVFYMESMYHSENPRTGSHVIIGPGPYDRRWYGNVKIENGIIVGVK